LAPVANPERGLVFIGFMGAGKSRAARAARHAGLEVLDADELLEAELGSAIDDFFAAEGEAEFRRREEALVAGLLDRGGFGAIALGGGAVLSERVRAALEPHVVVWLEADARTAWERVGGRRPLARDRQTFDRLFAQRQPLYESLASAVVPGRDDAPARSLNSVLSLRELPVGTRLAWAASASGEYPVYVGPGLLDAGVRPLDGRAFLVTDTTVGGLYGDRVGSGGTIEVKPGEGAKTMAAAERVLRELTAMGATRSDHVAALGGGVVGDLGGFCAAVYQRGVPVVQLPTTLVAQVDSALGGKTGVDLPEAKNYVGAYHLPAAVIADVSTLATLPERELAAGWAEVVKTALIAGGSLWERVRALEALDPAALDEIVFACARTKLAVVADDERDTGRRASLNLGHTVGHGIETATGYERYRHGEAVGLGLLAALELSGSPALRDEVGELLARQGLPTSLDPEVDVDAVLDAIGRDKKVTADGLGFVLCPRPGEVLTGQSVEPAALRAAIERLR
jgi:shikimate kinase/3-dehydroquinate synthase